MAASLAAHLRVKAEIEKTLAYAPDEIYAYRYLAECWLENGSPGQAELWYKKGLEREPLLADIALMYRIMTKKTDSLMLVQDARGVVQELPGFIERMEKAGTQQYWQHSELYLKLGSAYIAEGDTTGAVRSWRDGLTHGLESGDYYDGYAMMLAESLKAYNPVFNDDSIAALWPGTLQPYSDNFIWNTAQVLYSMCFNFVVWFFAGLIISIVVLAVALQRGIAEVRESLVQIRLARTIVDFLLFALVPALAVPILIKSIPGLSNTAVLAGAVSKSAGIIGIVLALLVLLLEARKKSSIYATVLFSRFIPLWLLNAVLLALLFSLLVMLYSMFLPFLGYAG